ncbi:MAG: PAS domain-containing protein [Planctomycetes bacterium]|nr:PAS domain-containing protein [Planctomycetota bacterium]
MMKPPRARAARGRKRGTARSAGGPATALHLPPPALAPAAEHPADAAGDPLREFFWLRDLITNRILYISPEFEAIFGRTRAELYRSSDAWLVAVHPEDRARLLVERDWLRTPDGPHEFEYRVVRPDGAIRWLRVRSHGVRGAAGEAVLVAGIGTDVTPLRTREHSRRLLHEGFLRGVDPRIESVLIVDVDGQILDANPAAGREFGYALRDLTNLSYFDLALGAVPAVWRSRWRGIAPAVPLRVAARFRRRDRSSFPSDVLFARADSSRPERIAALLLTGERGLTPDLGTAARAGARGGGRAPGDGATPLPRLARLLAAVLSSLERADDALRRSNTLHDELAGLRRLVAAGLRDLEGVPAGPLSAPEHTILSERERAVMQLIVAGLTSKEIAQRLKLGVRTVETHRLRLQLKLGVSGVAALTRYALQSGLVDPAELPELARTHGDPTLLRPPHGGRARGARRARDGRDRSARPLEE